MSDTAGTGSWASTTNIYTSVTQTGSVTVGQWLCIYTAAQAAGGTAGTYWARITAVSGGGGSVWVITLSGTAFLGTSPSSGSTYLASVGGAWKGPNGTIPFPMNQVKSTTTDASGDLPRVNYNSAANYAITSALNLAIPGSNVVHQGYTTTPGDGGRATFSGPTTGAQFVLLTISQGPYRFADIIFSKNGASGTPQNGISLTFTSSYAIFERCSFASMGLAGISSSTTTSTVSFIQCEAYSNQNGGGTGGLILAGTNSSYLLDRCISYTNAGTAGYILGTGCSAGFVNCIAYNNLGIGFCLAATSWAMFDGCAALSNSTDGFACLGGSMILTNCISTSNSGYGFNPTTGAVAMLRNCASYSNTSGRSANTVDDIGAITLSNDPYIAGALGNFALSSQAGSGALCRGAGCGTFTENLSILTAGPTIGFPDVGPAKCANSGGALRPSVVSPTNSPSLYQ